MPKYFQFMVAGYYLYFTSFCIVECIHVHASDRRRFRQVLRKGERGQRGPIPGKPYRPRGPSDKEVHQEELPGDVPQMEGVQPRGVLRGLDHAQGRSLNAFPFGLGPVPNDVKPPACVSPAFAGPRRDSVQIAMRERRLHRRPEGRAPSSAPSPPPAPAFRPITPPCPNQAYPCRGVRSYRHLR